MQFVFNDGGRAAAGYKGMTGDCTVRSIAIATQKPYQEVYDALKGLAQKERPRGGRTRSTVRNGTAMATVHRYMESLGWKWTATMGIGTGCKVHLADGELPMGRLVVRVTKHLTAVLDGVIHDNHDPQRETGRCVYGYWSQT